MAQYELANTFTRGEISPLAAARNDIELFQQGAETIINYLPLKEGGVTRRPGTYYCGETKFADKDTRLVDFVYSSTQAYALEFGDLYVRFWLDGEQITSGGSPYEVVSQYSDTDVRALSWVQSADTLFLALKSMSIKPQLLQRAADDNWSFSDVPFVDGPYLPINDQDNAVSSNVALTTDASVVFTFANTNNVNDGDGFVATDVGRHFRIQMNGKWSWGVITAVNSTTEIVVSISEGNGGGGAGTGSGNPGGGGTLEAISETKEQGSTNTDAFSSLSWRLGAFSDTTGYPKCVAFYNQRVVWGNTPSFPRTIWYSRANYPFLMSPSDVDGTVTSSHGGMLEIQGGRADEILWMQEGSRLQIGTASAIRSIGPNSDSEVFGPRNAGQRPEPSSDGVADVRPVMVVSSTVHVGRLGKGIHDLLYDGGAQGLVAPELSGVSDHMLKAGITELCWQNIPNKTLWAVLEDGKLATCVIERYEKVSAFARQDVDGTVISACCVPGSGSDTLFAVVRRTINGNTVQYVEKLSERFDGSAMDKEDAHFGDCGGVYTGAATNTVTGITWLANTEVCILADGAVYPNQVISAAGVLTLPGGYTAEKIHFGIPIEARVTPLRSPTALRNGPALGRKVRTTRVFADVYETLGLQFESDTGVTEELQFRPATTRMGQAPDLVTGTREVVLDGSWQSDGQFSCVCTKPLPATIRALNFELETE